MIHNVSANEKSKVTKQAEKFLILIENISLSKFINLDKKEDFSKNTNDTNTKWIKLSLF